MPWLSSKMNQAIGYIKTLGVHSPSLVTSVREASRISRQVAAQPHLLAGLTGGVAKRFAGRQMEMGSRLYGAMKSGYAQRGMSGAMQAGRVVYQVL